MLTRAKWTPPPRKYPGPNAEARGVMARSADVALVIPKADIVRSEPYRRYVAGFACFACGTPGLSQCAHANVGKGMAMKTSDAMTFPLCGPHGMHQGCHVLHDSGMELTRDERRAVERLYVARMQAIAMGDGWDLNTLRRTA